MRANNNRSSHDQDDAVQCKSEHFWHSSLAFRKRRFPSFASVDFRTFCEKFGVVLFRRASYHPPNQKGQAKSFEDTLKWSLKKIVEGKGRSTVFAMFYSASGNWKWMLAGISLEAIGSVSYNVVTSRPVPLEDGRNFSSWTSSTVHLNRRFWPFRNWSNAVAA